MTCLPLVVESREYKPNLIKYSDTLQWKRYEDVFEKEGEDNRIRVEPPRLPQEVLDGLTRVGAQTNTHFIKGDALHYWLTDTNKPFTPCLIPRQVLDLAILKYKF